MSRITSAYIQAQSVAKTLLTDQHHPPNTLYIVATPIGNLADISLRALYVLGIVDIIACEDTRHTSQLLNLYGLHQPLIALHEHNENEAAQQLITRLQQGQRVAYVSDAGTPAISDPGARLVSRVSAAGLRVMPLPGASSVTTLLSAAGCLSSDSTGKADNGFIFMGFLPPKGNQRQRALTQIQASPQAIVLFEAPHRIQSLMNELATLGDRSVTVGRELTKQFESITTLPAAALPAWLSVDKQNSKGEFALVVHPASAHQPSKEQDDVPEVRTTAEMLLVRLLAELPLKTAVQVAVDLSGLSKNILYDQALKLKSRS